MFSYGLNQHYFSMRIEADATSKSIDPEIAQGETLTRGEASISGFPVGRAYGRSERYILQRGLLV